MRTLRSALFERYKSLHRQKLKIEAELESIEREITDNDARHECEAPTSKSKPQAVTKSKVAPKSKSRPKARGAKGQLAPVTQRIARETITAMRDAGSGQPVTRRDVAGKLGMSDYATTYRLRRLQAMGFVERVGTQHYRVVDIVPEL